MAIINYTLDFYSYWHCGSGLSEGAGADALVIRDIDGLPFVPGKTIKGLVRQAVEEIYSTTDFSFLFGSEGSGQSPCFFTNAEIKERESILLNNLASSLFSSISSTRIDENGLAEKGSLRRIEVVIPCSLKGSILDVPDEYIPYVNNAVQYIKGIGLHRNRGLGRCRITIED